MFSRCQFGLIPNNSNSQISQMSGFTVYGFLKKVFVPSLPSSLAQSKQFKSIVCAFQLRIIFFPLISPPALPRQAAEDGVNRDRPALWDLTQGTSSLNFSNLSACSFKDDHLFRGTVEAQVFYFQKYKKSSQCSKLFLKVQKEAK